MSDRVVRKISPPPADGEVSRLFSTYSDSPNLVLLGDPGAGKTHLFRIAAAAEKTRPVSARDFLNLDVGSIPTDPALFIDALDEKRAGRGDQNTIDEIVRRLGVIKPKKVRIACRVADWLGETDLGAFQAYFNSAGSCVVVSLEPLSSEEQQQLLIERQYPNPKEFLSEAQARGLAELLTNPQNLIMLVEVVKARQWPKNRKELYSSAVEVLLAEHNPAHSHRDTGAYTSNELLDAAGAVCAVRLISDIAGISLSNSTAHVTFPTHRSIDISDRHHVQAALGRRIFEAGPSSETVDYTHRTVAEFLAASWLATRINSGLPIGRVRALLGFEGRPASELRGLHAWLALFVQSSAEVLIDADPFGVLTYGDASSLAPSLRKYLLEALARLADADPWFRAGNWSSGSVAALSGPDMANSFEAVLKDERATYSLRTIVLDALVSGTPIPALQPTLVALLVSKRPYGERERAVQAILRMGGDSRDLLCSVYAKLSGITEDELRVRATILGSSYGGAIGPTDAALLLHDCLTTDDVLIGGALRSVPNTIPVSDIPSVFFRLGELHPPSKRSEEPANWQNAFEVARVIDTLLSRYLESEPNIAGEALWSALRLRHRCVGTHGVTDSNELKISLSNNLGALERMIDYSVSSLDAEKNYWGFQHEIHELTLHSINNQLLLARLLNALDKYSQQKNELVFELALLLSIGSQARDAFEFLYEYGNRTEILRGIRDRNCVLPIGDWKVREIERRTEQAAKREATKLEDRAQFEANKELIRNAGHLGWMGHLAKFYWGRFADTNNEAPARDRLIAEFGEENAAIALEGFDALINQLQITTLDEIVGMHTRDKYFPWWYAVLAGLTEFVDAGSNISSLPDDYLRAACAIDCLHPMHRHVANSISEVRHRWKHELLQQKPQLFIDAYMSVVRADISRNASHVAGLHQLMNLTELEPCRPEAALSLLAEFPGAPSQVLDYLLRGVLDGVEQEKLRPIVDAALKNAALPPDDIRRGAWLALGFLRWPEEFKTIISSSPAAVATSAFWTIRDLSGGRHKPSLSRLSISQLGFLVDLGSSRFPKVGHPTGGWSGDTNPWDAAEFISHLINQLSADSSRAAAEALIRLRSASVTQSYHDDIKHSLEQQRIRRIDEQFQQPTFKEALEALKNGRPANIADLHALVIVHLNDLLTEIRSANTDIYKRFWNEDRHGRVVSPKPEESCRDVLVDLLRVRVGPHHVRVEPEGHMVVDKRADVMALLPSLKLVIELKRDYHADVWTGARDQLDRFYTRDPEARGFGIYGVFWFGPKRPNAVRKGPGYERAPRTAPEMEEQLNSLMAREMRERIKVLVLDVTAPLAIPANRKSSKRAPTKRASKSRKRKPSKRKAIKRASDKPRRRNVKQAPRKRAGKKKRATKK